MSAEPQILLPPGVERPWPGERALEAEPAVRRASLIRRHAADVVGGLASMLLALGGAAFGLQVWAADISVPFSYTHDGLLMLGVVKSLLDHGWWLTNASLGAPFGQELSDFPFAAGNTLHLLGLSGIGFLVRDPAVTLNVFYLAGFPLTALSAYVVLRKLGLSAPVSTLTSFLFAVLPYHFGRNVDHLFLSTYYTVPLACYLIVRVYTGRPLFERLSGGRRRTVARFAAITVVCVAIGATSTYYAVFAVLILLIGGFLSAIVHPRFGSLPGAALASGLILATLALAFAPVLAYRAEHGVNSAVATRGVDEAERLSLRVSELVLPVRHHRLEPLANLRERYETKTPLPSESNQALGLVASVGLFALLIVAAAAALGRRWASGPARELPPVAAATVVAIFVATTGGFSTVVSYLGISQLRGWNRMSIFVAFFSLLAVAALLEVLHTRLERRLRGRLAFAALLIGIGAVALLDQTNDSFVPQHAALKGEYLSDRGFVRSIERELAPGSSVYQLPFVSFPEEPNPPGGMSAYAHLAGYAHSNRLKWSFGAIRGRDADWAENLSPKPLEATVAALVASGFNGVYVDRLGYADAGSAVLGELTSLAGPARYSANGRRAFVDLRSYATELRGDLDGGQLAALRVLTLLPVSSVWGDSFWPLESQGGHYWRWTQQRRASFALANPGSAVRTVDVEFTLATGVEAAAQAIVRWPDGFTTLVDASPAGTRVGREVRLHPGMNEITIETNAAKAITPPEDPRGALYVRATDTLIRDVTFAGRFDAKSPFVSLFTVTSAPRS